VNGGREEKGYAGHDGHILASESANIESYGEENKNDYANAYHACGHGHGRTNGSENDAFLVLGWESEISERLRVLYRLTSEPG